MVVQKQKKVTEDFPKRRAPQTPQTTLKKKIPTKCVPVKDLSANEIGEDCVVEQQPHVDDETSLASFRRALDTSSPENLPGRESQIYEVKQFLLSHLEEKRPGSLYISGAPGTGKTAVVRYVLSEIMKESEASGNKKMEFGQIFINCMCRRSGKEIYELVFEKFKKSSKSGPLKEKVRELIFPKSKSSYMMWVQTHFVMSYELNYTYMLVL